MKYTNINILNNTGYQYPYAVGINTPAEERTAGGVRYQWVNDDEVAIVDTLSRYNILRNVNDYIEATLDDTTEYNMGTHKLCRVRVYWPTDSVDVYDQAKYAFCIQLHIGETTVDLTYCILSRVDDALAIPSGTIRLFNTNYVECTDFIIPDPWSIVYDDEWDDFRKNVCGERIGTNNEAAQVVFTINPIEPSSEAGEWIMMNGYVGSQNAINMAGAYNYLNLNISMNVGKPGYDGEPGILCETEYNDIYDSIIEYVQETYGIEDPKIQYEVVVTQGQELAYVYDQSPKALRFTSGETTEDSWVCTDLKFNDWSEYVDGLVARASINIYESSEYISDNPDDDFPLFSIQSNPFPITMEQFKYLTTNNNDHRIYNLENLDMTNYPITILNKTVKNVIQYDNVSDSKSNIIQPVFFRAYELEFITLHPTVTENICINLDIYKSKVDQFQIQVEGISFVELGRTSNGVVFKIQGSKLPKSASSGTYYILDEDGTLVTSGKYTYEM